MALANTSIKPRRGELRSDVLVYADKPNGETRLSYALILDRKVVAMATLGGTEAFNGLPCFQLNYAVEPNFRGQGLAIEIARAAIDEARNGLGRNGVKKWVVEAVIDADNTASLSVAKRLFSEQPAPKRDDAGELVYQFIEIVQPD
jgi:RimJ/RimL family protein N-acetyltransferase